MHTNHFWWVEHCPEAMPLIKMNDIMNWTCDSSPLIICICKEYILSTFVGVKLTWFIRVKTRINFSLIFFHFCWNQCWKTVDNFKCVEFNSSVEFCTKNRHDKCLILGCIVVSFQYFDVRKCTTVSSRWVWLLKDGTEFCCSLIWEWFS